MTTEIGIREAKAKLSAVLGKVKRGQVVIITERGRPVARMVPVRPRVESLAERIRELEERGWITSSNAIAEPLPPPPTLPKRNLAQRYLREDRDAR